MVLIALVALALVWCGACLVVGFGPAGSLDDFRSAGGTLRHTFHQPRAEVLAAYRSAVLRTPGMRIVDERDGCLLVDSRPTTRIMDGNFGMVIRLGFAPTGEGTGVLVEARNKVPWSLCNHEAALRHAERALRMNAKQHHLVQVV